MPQIPDHQLLRCIATGGYGEVWLAQNLMGTYRAVKVVYRANFSEERPFLREFEGIQRFEPISREHPGFVDVLQVGRNDQAGFFYYVMELADDANADAGATPRPINPDHYSPKTLRSILRSPVGGEPSAEGARHGLPIHQCLTIAAELASALHHLHQHQLVHRDIKPANLIFVHGAVKLADLGLVTLADTE